MRSLMRIGRAPLAAILLPWMAAGICHAAGRTTLAGRVIDVGGAGIADAIIYIRPVERERVRSYGDHPFGPEMANQLFVVRTGTQGRFIADLPGGSYEVAAFKPGYDFTLTAVNTHARGVLDLSLERSPGIVLGDLPVGSAGQNLGLDWILRRSPNGVLREVDSTGGLTSLARGEGDERGGDSPGAPAPGTTLAAGPPGRHGWLGALARSFDGQFVHRFSGGDPFGGGSASVGDTAGRETSLALSGDLSGRGAWRFLGSSARNSDDFARISSRWRDREAERFSVGLDYSLGDLDDLTAGIEYGASRYSVGTSEAPGPLTDQEQRIVGFHSRWDRVLSRQSRLFVDGVFHQAGVSTPETTIGTIPSGLQRIDRAVDREWSAGAGVSMNAGSHSLGFGIRTRNYRHDLRDQGIRLYGSPGESLLEGGARGTGMSLYAEDDWRVAERFVLNYGIGYHGSFSQNSGYLVPRVGFTHDVGGSGRTVVRSMVMLRVDQSGPPAESRFDDAEGGREEPGRLGYLIGLESRPEDRLQIAATYRYEPYRNPGPGVARSRRAEWTVFGERGLFLSDGAAAREELDVELARAFGSLRGIFAGSVGRVRGLVTPTLEAAPIQVLSQGEMRYYDTRVSAAYGPSETEVQLGYRWISTESFAESPGGVGDYRLIDLVVCQDLPWLSRISAARWQVLMSYQGLDYGSLYDGSGENGGGTTSRFSGGVDIRF